MTGKNNTQADKIINPFKEGNENEFVQFFRELYKPLCLFADRYVDRMDLSEELVSDVFLRVWERNIGFTGRKAFVAYLYNSVRNACINHIERKKPAVSAMPGETTRTMLENMIHAEVMHEIYLTIEQLPDQSQRVFTKLFLEGQTVRQIADELQLSVSTIKTQKMRALAFLRNKLSPPILFLLFCGPSLL